MVRTGFGLFVLLFSMLSVVSGFSKDLTIVVIPKSADQDYWKFVRRGIDRAVAEVGHIQLVWRGPAYNDDTAEQIQIVQRYSVPGTDAILLCPTDRDQLVAPVKAAAQRGIPVIVFDSALSGHYHQGFVATDNRGAGKLVARALVHDLGNSGEVVVLRTTQGSDSTDQRAEGFREELKTLAPGWQVVADVWGGGSSGKAFHASQRLLTQWPHPTAIFAVNESATLGMLQALGEGGLGGKVPLWGFDASPALVAALDRGEVQGLVVQDPDLMGYQALMMAVEYLTHKAIRNPTRSTDAVLVGRANRSQPSILKLLVP